jgi:hypothetical protein
MSYCTGKRKAIVTYTKPNKQRVKYESTQVPINVLTEQDTPGTYRFYGIGDDDRAYSFTASGKNPGYSLNVGFNSRGYTPTMDGVFIQPQNYYFVRAYGIEELVKPVVGCQIKITGSGNNFTDAIECPNGSFEVACDDECPEGYLKCEIAQYPGYCCIPCNEIKAGIISATAALRSINNG